MPLILTLVLLLSLPLVEIAVFIAVGSEIGVAWTLLLIVAATFGGIALVRRQSFATLRAARAEARAGRVPEREIIQGAMIVFAGILLILPGFVTDALGLLLLVPPLREALWRAMRSRVVVRSATSGGPDLGTRYARGAPRHEPEILDLKDGDFRRSDAARGGSPWRGIGTDGDDEPR